LVFDTGQRDHLPFGATAILGRDPAPSSPGDHLVAVRDEAGTVSKNHLKVEHAADGVWLTDLGSTNGTRMLTSADDGAGPGQVLPPGVRTRVDGVVQVAVGARVMRVSYILQGGRQ